MFYILNAFSMGMILGVLPVRINARKIVGNARFDAQVFKALPTAVSAVGHVDTARIFSGILGREIEYNRKSVSLNVGDMALVGQYSGPRLPEGATTLPEGASIEWVLVEILPRYKLVAYGDGHMDRGLFNLGEYDSPELAQAAYDQWYQSDIWEESWGRLERGDTITHTSDHTGILIPKEPT